jgi:hypothetical protein
VLLLTVVVVDLTLLVVETGEVLVDVTVCGCHGFVGTAIVIT